MTLLLVGLLLANGAMAEGLPLSPQHCASQWATVGRQAYVLGAMNASREISSLMVNAGDGKLDQVRLQLRAMHLAEAKRWRQAALITAAWAGQSREIDALLDDGADANATAQIPTFGKALVDQMTARNPLLFSAAEHAGLVDHGALRTSGPALVIAVECGDEATVTVLMRHQANASLRPGDGGADVLLWAILQGNAAIVSNLLDHGADACADDRLALQRRHVYVRQHPGYEKCIRSPATPNWVVVPGYPTM
jgi:ankyrin repeat protein